jgi:colicin import membrane protein
VQPSDLSPMAMVPSASLSTQRALIKSLLLHVLLLIGAILAALLQKAPPATDSPRVVEAVLVASDTLEGHPMETAAPDTATAPPEPTPAVVKPADTKPVSPSKTPPAESKASEAKASTSAKTPSTSADAAKLNQPAADSKPTTKADAKADKKSETTPNKKPLPALSHHELDDEMAAIEKELKASEAKRQVAAAAQAAQRSADAAMRDRYERLINERVIQKWLRPASARKGMVAFLKITALPDGQITGVLLVRSSGDNVFDQTAENAIWHSSPLPVPPDANVFNQYFRVFTLKFNPDDL